ncbi:tetratricopeptide repeat protein [Haloimpatiens sp. FM7330]|uniref:tetratricopeptide repeat protein n=1 Tax=Haloimpatiens sp. FM7330 TaxID=3298610 RepID=UPI00363A7E7C
MNKNKLTKKIIVSIVVAVVVAGAGFGSYKYYKVKTYNSLINSANKHMDKGEYEKAITLFEQSLNYKDDFTIKRNITLAKSLKEAKDFYDKGIKLMNDNKYIEAIDKFKKINKEDKELYEKAQKKIEECKSKYIKTTIDLANNAVNEKRYDDANKYLDEVLKIDSDNNNVEKLKEIIKEEQKKEQEKEKDKLEDQKKEPEKSKGITKEQACEIVKKQEQDIGENTVIQFDHEENKNGIQCYIIHVYDNMDTHTATRNWYYVDKSTGKIVGKMF